MHKNQLSNYFLTENLVTGIIRMHTSRRFALETLLATGFMRLELPEAKVLEHNAAPDRIQPWVSLSFSVTSVAHRLALWNWHGNSGADDGWC